MGKYLFFVNIIINIPNIAPVKEPMSNTNNIDWYPKNAPHKANNFISPPPIPSAFLNILYITLGTYKSKNPIITPNNESRKLLYKKMIKQDLLKYLCSSDYPVLYLSQIFHQVMYKYHKRLRQLQKIRI